MLKSVPWWMRFIWMYRFGWTTFFVLQIHDDKTHNTDNLVNDFANNINKHQHRLSLLSDDITLSLKVLRNANCNNITERISNKPHEQYNITHRNNFQQFHTKYYKQNTKDDAQSGANLKRTPTVKADVLNTVKFTCINEGTGKLYFYTYNHHQNML